MGIRSVQFNFVKAKKCPCAEDFENLIEMLIDPDYFLNPNVIVLGHFQDKEDHHDKDGEHHDEDGDNEDHSDWWDVFEDSEEKKNATTAETGEENDTKKLFGKVHPEEKTDEWTTANETKNATDSFYDEMNDFISDLTGIMNPDDSWDDWEEDNEDDMHTEDEDHHDGQTEAGMECNGMECNSTDHSANTTESVGDGESSSESYEEGFDGSFNDDGFPHTDDGSIDGHGLEGDDPTGDLGIHQDEADASPHLDSSYAGGVRHSDDSTY